MLCRNATVKPFLVSLVEPVAYLKSELVCGEDDGDGGKLLIYAPEENLADGAAKYPQRFWDFASVLCKTAASLWYFSSVYPVSQT